MKQRLPKNRVPVCVGIPFNLLMEIDGYVEQEGLPSRSDFVYEAVQEKMERIKNETK
jgi:metal-responsive CopG/Arc/MetJ family transcriptional regulator